LLITDEVDPFVRINVVLVPAPNDAAILQSDPSMEGTEGAFGIQPFRILRAQVTTHVSGDSSATGVKLPQPAFRGAESLEVCADDGPVTVREGVVQGFAALFQDCRELSVGRDEGDPGGMSPLEVEILPDVLKEAVVREGFHAILTGSYLGTP
jgi:hypothetical protein